MASAEIISSILDHEQEAAEAEQEGVRINWLRTITAFDGPELTVEVMELDEEGRAQPTGRLETLAADTIIMAVGQDADTAFLRQVPGMEFQRDGSVVVSQAMMTGCPGVFAGGDMVPDDWPLVRYDPVLRDAGRNPFLLDSYRPRLPLSDYTGVETADDVAAYLLAGADAVMTTSALLRHGPGHITALLDGLTAWMGRKGVGSVAEIRGLLAGATPLRLGRYGYLSAVEQATQAHSSQ